MLGSMSPSALTGEPACPPAVGDASPAASPRTLRAVRRAFDSIDAAAWDTLVARNPWATPFSRWAFHRAWWDAYSGSAHDQTLVVVDPAAGDRPVAIVPLMPRHAVEPTDAANAAHMRHGSAPELTPVEPHAKAVFFG